LGSCWSTSPGTVGWQPSRGEMGGGCMATEGHRGRGRGHKWICSNQRGTQDLQKKVTRENRSTHTHRERVSEGGRRGGRIPETPNPIGSELLGVSGCAPTHPGDRPPAPTRGTGRRAPTPTRTAPTTRTESIPGPWVPEGQYIPFRSPDGLSEEGFPSSGCRAPPPPHQRPPSSRRGLLAGRRHSASGTRRGRWGPEGRMLPTRRPAPARAKARKGRRQSAWEELAACGRGNMPEAEPCIGTAPYRPGYRRGATAPPPFLSLSLPPSLPPPLSVCVIPFSTVGLPAPPPSPPMERCGVTS